MDRPAALLPFLLVLLVVGSSLPAGAATGDAASSADPCIDNVAFFTTYSPANPPPFRVGFSADAGDAVFFVLETRGRIIGHTGLQTFEHGIHADGLRVPLTHDVAGVRNVTVTVYRDSNGNGVFDANTDDPCTSDGEPVASSLDVFVRGDGRGLSDTTVNATPAVAHQPANWTIETTVTSDVNVTHVDIDLRQAGGVGIVSPADVRVGSTPPVNATFYMYGHPANVSVHRGGVLRLTYPNGIHLRNGSRLTVRVDGVRVPAEAANVSVALTTPDAGYGATDSIDPAPAPHVEFYEGFPEEGVHLRFGLPKDVTMFAVVFHEGEVVGTKHLDYGYAMTADGQPVPVEGVAGSAELTVRGYYDANGNGFFDPETDRPFVNQNGELIGETAVIDLPGTSTTTWVSHDTPRTTQSTVSDATSSTSTTTVGAVGFGTLAAVVALAGIAVFLARD